VSVGLMACLQAKAIYHLSSLLLSIIVHRAQANGLLA
jgi:hypothetical protein